MVEPAARPPARFDSPRGRSRRVWLLLAVALVLPAAAPPVASDPAAERLVGTWRLRGSAPAVTIEFRADGTYRASAAGGAVSGRWTVTPEGRIATWSSPDAPKRINRFSVDSSSLVIIDERGRFHKHRRLGPTAADR